MRQKFGSVALFLLVFASRADAIAIIPFGQVTALTDVSQLRSVVGAAGFDLSVGDSYTSGTYAADGMVLQGASTGFGQSFAEFFPSIQSVGYARLPAPNNIPGEFPNPILGGGIQTGGSAYL